jgi:hypothetical protein
LLLRLITFLSLSPQYWYWELVETGRRLSLTAVLSVVAHGTSEQTVLSVIMSLFFVKLYAFYAPYSDDTDDVLAEVGQYQILFTFFAALIVQGELIRSSLVGPLGIGLVCINMGVMLVPLRLYFQDYQKTQAKKRMEEEEEREEGEGENESSKILNRDPIEQKKPKDEPKQKTDNHHNDHHKDHSHDHDHDNEIKPYPQPTTIEMAQYPPHASLSSLDESFQEQQQEQHSPSSSVKPSTLHRKVSLKPLPFSFGNSNKVLPSPRFEDVIGEQDEDSGWDDYKPAPKTFPRPE